MIRILTILKDWLINSFRKKKRILEPCQLAYIPNRLHTNDREPITTFGVGEFLFFRCDARVLSNPYNAISIVELSHNRSGSEENPLSQAADVLYNIVPANDFPIYPNKVVCTIRIMDLNADNQYDKLFKDKGNVTGRIKLLHDPVPCMFPHCFFRVWYNDEIATYDNKIYSKYNELRNTIKHEIASMIYTETLSQTG